MNIKQCITCGKPLSKRQKKYCSNACQQLYQYNAYIQNWLKESEQGTAYSNSLSITNNSPLEIHHIDGDYRNNNLYNLQVLCPNCHSLTSNYKALNQAEETRTRISNRKRHCADCGKEISSQAYYCKACAAKRKITIKPLTREELKKAIREKPFTLIGKEQNVSDNAIRKWCKQYNLPTKKTQIKNYSDEEWKKI